MKPEQTQGVLQLMADVLVEHDYAAEVVCIARGKVSLNGEEPRDTVVMATAPDVVELQLGVSGSTITAVIGPTGEGDILEALQSVLKSFDTAPDNEPDPA